MTLAVYMLHAIMSTCVDRSVHDYFNTGLDPTLIQDLQLFKFYITSLLIIIYLVPPFKTSPYLTAGFTL